MHRLVIVDDENRVLGVISLSDILTYIVLKCESRTKPPPYHSGEMSGTAPVASNKTASLTQAFGLTRLSASHDHIVLAEASQSSDFGGVNSHNPHMTMTNSDHGTIFEDDPMETEQQQLKTS